MRRGTFMIVWRCNACVWYLCMTSILDSCACLLAVSSAVINVFYLLTLWHVLGYLFTLTLLKLNDLFIFFCWFVCLVVTQRSLVTCQSKSPVRDSLRCYTSDIPFVCLCLIKLNVNQPWSCPLGLFYLIVCLFCQENTCFMC